VFFQGFYRCLPSFFRFFATVQTGCQPPEEFVPAPCEPHSLFPLRTLTQTKSFFKLRPPLPQKEPRPSRPQSSFIPLRSSEGSISRGFGFFCQTGLAHTNSGVHLTLEYFVRRVTSTLFGSDFSKGSPTNHLNFSPFSYTTLTLSILTTTSMCILFNHD